MLRIVELSNGIRLVHQAAGSEVAVLGMVFPVGSRCETAAQHGIAHLAEHMLFKGTRTRNYRQLMDYIESVGADLNAYTTKEYTFIDCTFLKKHYLRGFEVISDIFYHSIFPSQELLKERSVILEEINYYKDNPDENIFDEFEQMLFGDTSLGRCILGTAQSVKGISQRQLQRFVKENYFITPPVISLVGDIPEKYVDVAFRKYFSEGIFSGVPQLCHPPVISAPFMEHQKKETNQAHILLGNAGYSMYHPRRYELQLLQNFLGGPAMSSRLNLLLREKYGLCYMADAHYTLYSDTGVVTFYLGTDKKNIDRCLELVYKELSDICKGCLTNRILEAYKEQIKGQLAIGLDSRGARMSNAARTLLFFNKPFSIRQLFKRIDLITVRGLTEVANELLEPGKLSLLIYS